MREAKSYKVLIVEDDPVYAEPLRECLHRAEAFTILDVTDSATKAYRLAKSGLPDVVIVDLELAEGDGLELICRLRDPAANLPISPYILVLTEFQAKPMLKKLKSGLADFVIKKENKGYTPEMILNHLTVMQDLFFRNQKPEELPLDSSLEKEALIRKRVDSELDQYYIRQGGQARDYLAEIIYRAVVLPKHEKIQMTRLYAEVGKLFANDPHNVNMAVNRLLHTAFNKTAQDDLERLYTPYVDLGRGAPRAKEFVAYTADKIRKEHIT